MNQLTQPNFIKDLLRHYQLKPKDYLGQNFLVDELALDQIVEAADLKKTDTVVEVGPGLGVLTQQLASRAGKVIALEKDRTMLDILDFNLKEFKNVQVLNQDALRFNVSKSLKGRYKVVANIPYYLTSKLFQFFLEQGNQPELMVLLVQKEVGERITAQAGEMSVLAVSVQLYSDPEVVAEVSKRSFWPSPKVDSVIMRITPRVKYPEVTDRKKFFSMVKVAFAAKRKQLHNNLTNGLHMDANGVAEWLASNSLDPKLRAQDLSMEEWVNLYRTTPQQK
jgi:16S rRNA (adenine1518-N6/adenine1519-N6)-dimethyltransferase